MTETVDILPFVLYGLVVAAVVGGTLAVSWFVGDRSRHAGARDIPFESGVVPQGDAEDMRFSIEFYLIAMFFVIFDLETIFLIGWAVAFFEVGWPGFVGASIFIVILLVALVYEFRTGALEWGVKSRFARTPGYAQQSAAGSGDEGGNG